MTNNNKEISTPPADPVVGSARFAQRPISTPKTPEVQPIDASSRIKALLKPKMNKVTDTDKPRKEKPKKANTANTNTPSYLKPPKEVPEVRLTSLMKFLNWFEENRIDTQISKMSLPAIAGFEQLQEYYPDSTDK